jgi:hypothetical protein
MDRRTGAGLVDRSHGQVGQGSTRPRQSIHLCLEPHTHSQIENSQIQISPNLNNNCVCTGRVHNPKSLFLLTSFRM